MFSVHTLRMSSSTPPRRGLGANLAAFRRAKQLTLSCREYARQLPSGTDGAVAAGVAGALLGAAVSPRGMRSDGAGWGAFFGAPVGAETAVRSQEGVVRNCLIGRGYRVLN